MVNKETISNIIDNIINGQFEGKCSRPDYITGLPGDLRTTDIDILEERFEALDDELYRREDILKKAEYRIGVKTRDTERLQKRIDKHNEKIEKAENSIAGESDKIFKNISKLEDKVKKIDDDTSSVESALDRFKKAHNNFFTKDLTKDNSQGYTDALNRLSEAGDNLQNVLKTGFDNGLFNKTDLKAGDISSNINRIQKNIDKVVKAYNDIDKDRQKINDNLNDIDYIVRESKTVQREVDILNDDYDKSLQLYLELGGNKDMKPGFNQEGHGYKIPELIDEMEKLANDIRKETSKSISIPMFKDKVLFLI